jgi:uncharacterized protein (TIGR02996 family)
MTSGVDSICFEEHCLQVLADADDSHVAYYFFDDDFLASHAGLASYFLLDDWRLPDGAGAAGWVAVAETDKSPHVGGEGSLYVVELELACEHLRDLDMIREIPGVRVPGVCRWLMSLESVNREQLDLNLIELREALLSADLAEGEQELAFLLALRENPQDDLTWNAYSDWLGEHGSRPAGLHLLERGVRHLMTQGQAHGLMQVGDHVAQTFVTYSVDPRYDHWFFFDDLWGSAHPDLADALLRYGSRWDVLSTGDETEWE